MSKNEHDEWPQGDGESDFDYLLRCLAEHKESHVAWAKHLEHYPPESERAAQALGTAPEQWADAARYDKLIAITGKLIARNVMLVEVVAALSLPAETLEIASCNHVAHVARQARENAALYFQKWTEAISTLPRSSQNQTVSGGVEGAHEGTTADKSGWCECGHAEEDHSAAGCAVSDQFPDSGCECNKFKEVALAESSLSSPPPVCELCHNAIEFKFTEQIWRHVSPSDSRLCPRYGYQTKPLASPELLPTHRDKDKCMLCGRERASIFHSYDPTSPSLIHMFASTPVVTGDVAQLVEQTQQGRCEQVIPADKPQVGKVAGSSPVVTHSAPQMMTRAEAAADCFREQSAAQERWDAANEAMEILNPPPNWPEHYAEAMAIIDGRNTEPVDRRHLIAMRAERLDHASARARRELKA